MSFVVPFSSCYVFGALRYFSTIRNCVCLIHGPVGCSFFHRASILNINQISEKRERMPRIFSTDFDERDTIFGGIAKLQQAVRDIDEQYHPDLIVILNCCVSEVIGEDIENLALALKNEVRAEVVPVRGAGFKGDHKKGMKDASLILYDAFIKPDGRPVERCPRAINFIGELNPNLWSIRELQSVLSELGITTNCIVPTECSVDDLRRVPNAALNYVVCNSASGKLADRLHRDFQMPFVGKEHIYFGAENSASTLREILTRFGIVSSKPEQLYEGALRQTVEDRKALAGRTACVVCGTRRSLGYSSILKELGIDITLIFAESDEDWRIESDLRKRATKVLVNDTPEAVLDYVQQTRPDFVLTSLPDLVIPERFILGCEDFYGFGGFVHAARFLRRKLDEHKALWLRTE